MAKIQIKTNMFNIIQIIAFLSEHRKTPCLKQSETNVCKKKKTIGSMSLNGHCLTKNGYKLLIADQFEFLKLYGLT